MDHWCNLPSDLVKKIEEHLVLFVDKVRFRCVCVPWQSAMSKLPDLRQRQLPWLLLPYHSKKSRSRCDFFNPMDKNVYELDVPEVGEKVFKGTYDGWVVIAQVNASIHVVNPLSRARVELPPRSTFPDVIKYRADKPREEFVVKELINRTQTYDSTRMRNYKLGKVILSSSPNSEDFVAVALYGVFTKLAYCKYGDKKWSPLIEPNNCNFGYNEVTFYEEKLYAIKNKGQLLVCNNIRSFPSLRIVVSQHPSRRGVGNYLAPSRVGLMMMFRREDGFLTKDPRKDSESKYLFKTLGFDNMYVFDSNTVHWIEIHHISDSILFMGYGGTQQSVSSREFPECKGNAIFFVGDDLIFEWEGVEDCCDEGVCGLDTGIVKPLGYNCYEHSIWPSPIWVKPNPY